MRNRRLLTLAVLAVAIGFAAQAEAWTPPPPYYGTAVVTLIRQTEFDVDGNSTFDINVRLWDDAGIGEPAVDTAGLIDFNIASITGGTSGAVVKSISVTAPLGEVTDNMTNTYLAGFTKELIYGSGGNFDVSSVQPVMYGPTPPGTNEPLRDAAILIGVGTTGREAGDPTQNHVTYPDGDFSVDPGDYAGDTPIIHGIYSGDGVLGTITFGVISFSVLPTEAPFAGPMADPGTSTTVKAVVIQTTTIAGNDGGAAIADNPTSLKVEFGDVTLGAAFKGGQQKGVGGALSTKANVTVNVDADNTNTSVTLGAYQVLAGLNINTAMNGTQLVDIAQYGAAIYAGNGTLEGLNAAELGILAAIETGVSSGGTEGLISSDPRVGSGMSIGFAKKKIDDLDPNYLEVKLTLTGDASLDGKVDGTDLASISINWDVEGTSGTKKWYNGDLNLDGKIDGTDLAMVSIWWNPEGNPIPGAPVLGSPAVPEPATLGLLALGALGLIRRRKA